MTAFIVSIVIAGTVLFFAMPNKNQIYDNGHRAGYKKGAQEARRELERKSEGVHSEWAEKLLSAGFEAGIEYAESGVQPNFEKLTRSLT